MPVEAYGVSSTATTRRMKAQPAKTMKRPESSYYAWCNCVADFMRAKTTLSYSKRFALAGVLILGK